MRSTRRPSPPQGKLCKCLVAAACAMLAITAPALAQDAPADAAPDAPPAQDFSLAALDRFTTGAELNEWFATYRTTLDPERVPAAIVAYSEFGRLNGNRPLVILSAFFAEIIRTHPEHYRAWDEILRDGNEAERWLLWNAIWWSGVEGSADFFAERIKTARPRDRETLQYFIDNEPVDLMTTELDSEIVLVALAYSYFGSGNTEYLHRMAEPLSTRAMTPDELATGITDQEKFADQASRLLTNYAVNHDDVLAFCEDIAVNGDRWQRTRMGRVVAGARRERALSEQDATPAPAGPQGPFQLPQPTPPEGTLD